MVKPSYYDRMHMKQALCTEAEDTRVATNVSKHATGNFTGFPKKTGLKRCGRNCKSKGNNQRADLVHNNFSPEEEELAIKLHATIGSRWSIIAQQLPERSDDDVKNLWNTKLKKKLSAMGIDPITHRPFSQILADYGNIGGIQKGRTTRFAYLNREGTNPSIQNSQQSSTPQEDSSSSFNYSHFSTRLTSSFEIKPSNDPSYAPPYDHSLELLSQLQAIKMVTEASNYNHHNNNNSITQNISPAQMATECISSSASSSTRESPTNKALESTNFSWSDFLSVDAFLPANPQDLEEHEVKMSSNDVNIKESHHHHSVAVEEGKISAPINTFEGSCSFSSGSFVEDMLERENEFFTESHGILEEPFYYY